MTVTRGGFRREALALRSEDLSLEPLDHVFINRRGNQIRVLYFDRSGFQTRQAHALLLAEALFGRHAAGFELLLMRHPRLAVVASSSASLTPVVVDLERHCPRARIDRNDAAALTLTLALQQPRRCRAYPAKHLARVDDMLARHLGN